MSSEITISSKGQIAIPKDVRDRLGLATGEKLRITESGGAIVLRPVRTKHTMTFEEAEAKLRQIVHYEGPPVSIDEMNETIRDRRIDTALRRDERSRH